jgi:hypothetical protein
MHMALECILFAVIPIGIKAKVYISTDKYYYDKEEN